MAKHQITINIVSKQTKQDEKKKTLENAVGNNNQSNPKDKLLNKNKKQSDSDDKKITKKHKAKVKSSVIKLAHTLPSTALSLSAGVGDYSVESKRIQSTIKLGTRIATIANKSATSGPLWPLTLALELANWAVEMGENNIQWNHQQQLNTIEAERASNRLGIVATSGNRNMKL